MRYITLLLPLFLSLQGFGQTGGVRELPEFTYRPVPPKGYRWKEAQPPGTAILFGNTLAGHDSLLWSFGGFDTVDIQRSLCRVREGVLSEVEGVRYPGEGFVHNIFFARDSVLYIGGGSDSAIARYAAIDFWRYDLRTAAWTRLRDLPFYYNQPPFLFTHQNSSYALVGVLSGKEFEVSRPVVFRYDTEKDEWKALPESGLVPLLPVTCAFVSGDEVFVLFGDGKGGIPAANPFFRYSLTQGTWTVLPRFPGEGRAFAFSWGDGRYGFVGGGLGRSRWNFRDVYRFDPAESRWARVRDLPYGLRRAKGWSEGSRSLIGFGLADGGYPAPVFELKRPQ